MLLAIVIATFWGWLIQPSPFLHGVEPLQPIKLDYDRELFIEAFCGKKEAQHHFLKWRKKKGAKVHIPSHLISNSKKPPTVFTQSFACASLALALCKKDQIIAVPSQLKLQTKWHNEEILKAIPYTTEKVDTELLYELKPQRCLASHFSSPSSIERFNRLGFSTLILPPPNQIEDIETSITQTADFVNRIEEGQWLLETFKQSLFWLKSELPKPFFNENSTQIPSEVLIIELYKQMSLPSSKQLYMQWLLSHDLVLNKPEVPWSTPIDYETLYTLRPKLIIILCEHIEETSKKLSQDPKWQHLIQETNLKYTLISTQCLRSPSQIFAIGLYDLVAALKLLNTISPQSSF